MCVDNVTIFTLSASTDINNPPAPKLIYPENGSATDNTPEFKWSSVDDRSGVSYELQYSNSDNFPESWLEGWGYRRPVTVAMDANPEHMEVPEPVTDGLGRCKSRSETIVP
ncbi:MAG: hypothetical protein AB1305_04785 [Candidatus Hadarchaeota archaeon]